MSSAPVLIEGRERCKHCQQALRQSFGLEFGYEKQPEPSLVSNGQPWCSMPPVHGADRLVALSSMLFLVRRLRVLA